MSIFEVRTVLQLMGAANADGSCRCSRSLPRELPTSLFTATQHTVHAIANCTLYVPTDSSHPSLPSCRNGHRTWSATLSIPIHLMIPFALQVLMLREPLFALQYPASRRMPSNRIIQARVSP